MQRHLQAFEEEFTPMRDHIIKSLQIKLAYLVRKRIADKKERARLAEIKRKEEVLAAKKMA